MLPTQVDQLKFSAFSSLTYCTLQHSTRPLPTDPLFIISPSSLSLVLRFHYPRQTDHPAQLTLQDIDISITLGRRTATAPTMSTNAPIQGPVEARSLSSITTIASNPPAYPRNPTHEKLDPLQLYIVRVPGSQGR